MNSTMGCLRAGLARALCCVTFAIVPGEVVIEVSKYHHEKLRYLQWKRATRHNYATWRVRQRKHLNHCWVDTTT